MFVDDSSDNVFDDTNELHLTTPIQGYSPPRHPGDGSMTSEVSVPAPPGLPTTMPSIVTMPSRPEASASRGDYFEMAERR